MESRTPWRWTARVSRNTETFGKVKYGATIVKTNWGIKHNAFPLAWAWRKATLVLGRVSYRAAVLQGISAVSPRFNHKKTSILLLLFICRIHRTKYIQLTKQEMKKLARFSFFVFWFFYKEERKLSIQASNTEVLLGESCIFPIFFFSMTWWMWGETLTHDDARLPSVKAVYSQLLTEAALRLCTVTHCCSSPAGSCHTVPSPGGWIEVMISLVRVPYFQPPPM